MTSGNLWLRISSVLTALMSVDGTPAWAAEAAPDPRAGLVESFDRVDGWHPGRDPDQPDPAFAPRSVSCEEGRMTIDTHLGTLSQIAPSYFERRGIVPNNNPVWLSKRYGEVDIDRYPYLVARMPKSQCFVMLRVNEKETRVLHTTGLHVEDLRDSGLRGRQPMVLQIMVANNYGRIVLDDVRLVSELTEEEKIALIPRGYEVRPQGLVCPPYQGLEALFQRNRAPLSELLKSEAFAGGGESSEWALFRDQATGAPVERLTRHPGTDAGEAISANGRWVMVDSSDRPAKRSVCDLQTGRIFTLPPGQHAFFPADGDRTALVEFQKQGERGRIVVSACELPGMEITTLIDEEVPEAPQGQFEMAFSEVSNRLVFGFRDHEVVYLADPDAPAGDRLRRFELPYPIKNLWLTDKDRFILFGNCFTYQTWLYDYEADQLHPHSQRRGGGHTALGGGMLFRPYGKVGKVIAPFADGTDEPGASVRLHGNYHNSSVPVDYGIIAPDRRWAFHDGIGGDVDRQIVAFDLEEAGNVIPVFFHNSSSVGYDVKPYLKVSPDSTKILLYSSDMLGDGDIYLVPFQRPDPPRDTVVRRGTEGLQIEWTPAPRSAETRGYNLYHSEGRTVGFVRLNEQLISGNGFLHRDADPRSVYLVTAVEHSRLESRFSAPAMLPERLRDDAVCVFLEAEEAEEVTLPFRRQYDGYAANFATMRLMPETPGEVEGILAFDIPAGHLHERGEKTYRIALRCRLRSEIYPGSRGGEDAVIVEMDGSSAVIATVPEGPAFSWCIASEAVILGAGDRRITVRSSLPGVEIDRVAFYSEDADTSWLGTGATNAEPEAAVAFIGHSGGVEASADGPFALILGWPGPDAGPIDHYSIHASATPNPGASNETLVGSTRGALRFRDTGLRPASQAHYLVVGYDSRGRKVVAYRGGGQTAALLSEHRLPLSAAAARLDPAFERVEDEGRLFVRIRRDADAGQRSTALRYAVDIPETGDYAVWIYNRPHNRNSQVRVTVGEESGNCRLSRYMRPGHRVEYMAIGGRNMPEERWYVARVTFGRRAPQPSADIFPLEAGSQEIVVSLDIAGQQPRSMDLGDIIVTNDLTWHPDDHDPRTQFLPEE